MPSARLLPKVQRHDLSELPYSPTIWQRVGGPSSITLRAYLWTAPLGILAQPVVEPSFWNDFGTFPMWMVCAGLGYLAFGFVLWLGWLIFVNRQARAVTSPVLVIAIAVVASMARSTTIGLLVGPFGFTGVDWVGRLPFGAFLGFAWVITTSLIMDSKYRYQLHLESLVTEQVVLLQRNRQWLSKVRQILEKQTQEDNELAHRQVQQAMREIAILSNEPKSIWAKVTPEIKRASIRIALADENEVWTSDKNLSDVQGSRSHAFAAITTTPLMNVPFVMTFTAAITFLGATRLYPPVFSLIAVTYGVLLHISIIQFFKFLISRNHSPSAFRYFLMTGILMVSSLLSTSIASLTEFDLVILRTIALTATIFEIVWLVATGFIQYGQIQRQKTIDCAKTENEQLELAIDYWQERSLDSSNESRVNNAPLLDLADAMKQAVAMNDLQLGLGAMAFSNLYFAEFAAEFLGQDGMDIESELARISRTWKQQSEVIWTVSGAQVNLALARKVVAALEVCVSKAIRHGGASVISVDVKRLEDSVSIKVSDNGQDYVEGGSGLGVEILRELSNGTWQRDRSGGLNIVTAQFS